MEAARNPWPALGTLLVRDEVISPEQLELALATKLATPEVRLGEILVEQGACTRAQIARVLAEQHELEYVELEDSMIEPEASGLLSEALARRYLALPVRFNDDGTLLVAVADPTNVLFSDELRLALRMPIRVGVASSDSIEAAISRVARRRRAESKTSPSATKTPGPRVLDFDAITPAVVFVNKTIARALDLGASDIHFTPQQRRLYVRARVDGVVREITSIGGSLRRRSRAD